jgi:hypothetical protein
MLIYLHHRAGRHLHSRNMAKQIIPPTPSHSSPMGKSPMTPISKSFEPKARTPSNRYRTYKQSLANDHLARYKAISSFKETDTYIYEMCHSKREAMLQAIAAEVDAKRIETGEHTSCLFEEVEIQEARLSFEEAAQKWEMIRAEVATKTSGLRGKAKPKAIMLPKMMDALKKKVAVESVMEVEESFWVKEEQEPEMVTSKRIPLLMIDDDDD